MSASNYPPGLSDFTPGTPWNEPIVPEETFEVTCSQSLSKTVKVTTDNYTPGAAGVDYESDGEGHTHAVPYRDDPDTSDTDWAEEYMEHHYTPLQLINMFRNQLGFELHAMLNGPKQKIDAERQEFLEELIEECSNWIEDEVEFINN